MLTVSVVLAITGLFFEAKSGPTSVVADTYLAGIPATAKVI